MGKNTVNKMYRVCFPKPKWLKDIIVDDCPRLTSCQDWAYTSEKEVSKKEKLKENAKMWSFIYIK